MPAFPADMTGDTGDTSEDLQLVIQMYEEKLGRPLTVEEHFKISTMFNANIGGNASILTEE
jgi:hypothetical protein